ITPAQTDFTCGIENSQGTDGIQYSFDGTYAPNADPIVGGRAIKFTTDTTGLVTGIEENRPLTLALLGVSRNPIKGEGYITFQVPSRMVVRVELIDVQGRVVKVLADGAFERGTHRVKLDGSKLSGGVYFVRMKADKVDKVQKIMIVR
ncbi:MAG: T9SS type A sorting domain-containing protein, partial [Candidatus Hydrothermia bacterium]